MRGRVSDSGPDVRYGDLELLVQVRGGDAHAANQLIERHLQAVRPVGGPDAADAGREVLHRVLHGEPLELPFRVAWLAQLARGTTDVSAPPDDAVWSAYAGLPAAWRLAVWHREVEGQGADAIGHHLGMGEREATRALVSSYAALKRSLAVTHARAGLEDGCQALHDRFRFAPPALLDRHQVTRLREHARHCDDCLGLVRDVFVVEHTLAAALAGVVLGDAAGSYLAARPRPRRLKAAAAERRPLPVRARSVLAVATAASLGVAATSFVVLGRPGPPPGFSGGGSVAEAAVVPPTLVRPDDAAALSRVVLSSRTTTSAPARSTGAADAAGGAATGPTPPGSSEPAGAGPTEAPADGSDGSDGSDTPDTPVAPTVPALPDEPEPEPEPAAAPLVEVDLGAGVVSVDPGLPTGPVEVELPVSVPVPAVSLPGLPAADR